MIQVPPAIIRSEFIYESGPTRSCHASSIAEVRPGVLVAAWFGGDHEGDSQVAIYTSRWSAGHWSKTVEVANGDAPGDRRYACWNPVLYQLRSGPLLLFYKVGTGPSTWWGMMTRSTTGGVTWDRPTRLPSGILGPIKNPPIELQDGELLCPSSSEPHGWTIHFERTSDMGKTWSSTGPLNDPRAIGAIQPSILNLGGRRLRAVGRTRQGRLFAIDSADLGRTWGPMRLLNVPNPNSGTDAVTLRDGRFLLVYNPTTSGRTPLSVAVSSDGESWSPVLTLESEPGEYSYPTAIQTADGLVHITYTWRRERIRHVVVDPEKLGR